MTKQPDDLEAVRTLVAALEPFEKSDRERIIRWACEKLGLATSTPGVHSGEKLPPPKTGEAPSAGTRVGSGKDIKTFVGEKKPSNDNQFVATVAYYYRFEAPEGERKESITREELQDACRKAGRERFKSPSQTLINARNSGLLDNAGRGAYAINTVGENLVAMTLPERTADSSGAKSKRKTTKGKKDLKKRSSK
jgi:hypothetical protein